MALPGVLPGIPGHNADNSGVRAGEALFEQMMCLDSVVVFRRRSCAPAYTDPALRTHHLPLACSSVSLAQSCLTMIPAETSPELPSASLVGSAHVIGALELRRLLLEGAILVFDHGAPDDVPSLLHRYVVLEATDGAGLIHELLPRRDELLVCLRQDWSPALLLAKRLSSHGYQLVFTADSQAASLFASDVFGVLDQP